MAEHLVFGEHLTPAQYDAPLRETYIGQAHIAGTGPAGTTCRECVFWCRIGWHYDENNVRSEKYVKPHAYYGPCHEKQAGEIKKHLCTRPILNKANRRIPHDAKSCRLFEAAENPPPTNKAVAQ